MPASDRCGYTQLPAPARCANQQPKQVEKPPPVGCNIQAPRAAHPPAGPRLLDFEGTYAKKIPLCLPNLGSIWATTLHARAYRGSPGTVPGLGLLSDDLANRLPAIYSLASLSVCLRRTNSRKTPTHLTAFSPVTLWHWRTPIFQLCSLRASNRLDHGRAADTSRDRAFGRPFGPRLRYGPEVGIPL